MRTRFGGWNRNWRRPFVAIASGLCLLGAGCGGGVSIPGTTVGTTDSGTTEPGSNTAGGDNALLNEALSFGGSLSGEAADSQSTRESVDSESAAQTLPLGFETDDTTVSFRDLEGAVLLDPNGQPIDEVPMNPDGSFEADGLPVGADFIVCADFGDDGNCDIETCVHIPAAENEDTGRLDDVRIDPLTTLILAKLRALVQERGIEICDLPVSPAAVAKRIVDAYTHLFEESGIDHSVSLDDLGSRAAERLAELFDTLIPEAAQSGMHIVEGNLDIAVARDVDAVAVGVAEVFLRAGFPIGDDPGGLDLSPLAELDGVTVTTLAELYGPPLPFEEFNGDFPDEFLDEFPHGFPDEFPDEFRDEFGEMVDEFADGFSDAPIVSPAEADDFDDFGPIVYISELTEPDRNFISEEGGEGFAEPGNLPIIFEHLLLKMAELHMEGRRITLGDLYTLLTSIDHGLGARLTFFIDDPLFYGPPLNVFETLDGEGKAINLEEIFLRLANSGFDDFGYEDAEIRDIELRAVMTELLRGTIPPTFDRLFGGFATARVAGIEELARGIREKRAHLPFNRSGESSFFVVADGDPYRGDTSVSEITVDVDMSIDGLVDRVVYNPAGNGKFLLGFNEFTEDFGIVDLIVAEVGKRLHGIHGPVRLDMTNALIFEPINGIPFFEFVSEHGTFYPGVIVSIFRDDYVPEYHDPIELEPASFEEEEGPHEQLFVLATGFGPDAEPVHVEYDPFTGEVFYNPNGRHLLMFVEDSEQTGRFMLFNEALGRPAGEQDPDLFFDAPRELPDGFEEVFNDVEDFADFENFEDLEQAFEDIFFEEPFEEPFPPDEEPLPPDEESVPPPADEPVDPAQLEDQPVGDETIIDEPFDEFVDEELVFDEPFDEFHDEFLDEEPFFEFFEPQFIFVYVDQVIGLDLGQLTFTHVFGTEVPNPRYNPDEDPYFDDINGNGIHDLGEPTSPYRPLLFEPTDWRATDIRLYYRRADNNGPVPMDEVQFDSRTPQTIDGVALVPRNYLPRLNAFRFGRPNTAINLLTAFLPPEFFNGRHAMDQEASFDIFSAVAIINLVMDQVFNIEADVDLDGLGPLPRERVLMDAYLFVVPIDDPFLLLLKGFDALSERPTGL